MASVDVDLEDDRWLQDSPPTFCEPVSKPSNKRAKALNIDDLLRDHYKEKNKTLDQEKKRARYAPDSEDSEDEALLKKSDKEQKFEDLVESCEKQVHAGGAIMEIPKWGEILFAKERRIFDDNAQLVLEGPVVQAICAAREQIVKFFPVKEEGSTKELLSELLANGWLRMLGTNLDDGIMRWVFHTMVFSTDKKLETEACSFLCHLLQAKSKSQNQDYRWMPSYDSILATFKAYGYLSCTISHDERIKDLMEVDDPPNNLESLLAFLAVAFKTRHIHQVYSAGNAESLLMLISTFSLDRQLLCLAPSIQECLVSIINSFQEDEWPAVCERVAVSITGNDRSLVNSLRLTRSLHSIERRMKVLQSLVAIHFLSRSIATQVDGGVWQLLSVFGRVDLKKDVDFVSLYHHICLADIWLWSNSVLKSDQSALDSWLLFLKACSFQISSTDWRPYASKVRNWASYLLQVYLGYHQVDCYEGS